MQAAQIHGMETKHIEEFLTAWVSRHLNKGQPVDPSWTMMDYGIDSVRAVLLSEDTKNVFGFEWPPYVFFNELSIRELAEEGARMMEEM